MPVPRVLWQRERAKQEARTAERSRLASAPSVRRSGRRAESADGLRRKAIPERRDAGTLLGERPERKQAVRSAGGRSHPRTSSSRRPRREIGWWRFRCAESMADRMRERQAAAASATAMAVARTNAKTRVLLKAKFPARARERIVAQAKMECPASATALLAGPAKALAQSKAKDLAQTTEKVVAPSIVEIRSPAMTRATSSAKAAERSGKAPTPTTASFPSSHRGPEPVAQRSLRRDSARSSAPRRADGAWEAEVGPPRRALRAGGDQTEDPSPTAWGFVAVLARPSADSWGNLPTEEAARRT